MDETTLASARAKVVFENEEVRVLFYHFDPGDNDDMHGQPDDVQIWLTDAVATVTTPNATPT